MKNAFLHPIAPLPIATVTSAFFGVFFLLNRMHHLFCRGSSEIACVDYWPISIFLPRQPPNLDFPNLAHISVAALSFLALVFALAVLPRVGFRMWQVALVGFVLVLGTNLAHGLQFGLVRPVTGMDQGNAPYYDDAMNIDAPWALLGDYQDRQLELGMHSKTHPPGPVLLFYFLGHLLPDAYMISIALALVSVLLVASVMVPILATEFTDAHACWVVLIFLLLPSVQIYYATSIDALIAGLFIGSFLMFFTDSKVAVWISIASFVLASFFTFLAVFVPAVMFAFEVSTRKRISKTAIALGGAVVFYSGLFAATGFNYLRSFLVASAWENQSRFMLFAEPQSYIATRLEDVAEIILFFGPILALLFLQGLLRRADRGKLMRLAYVAFAVFVLMLTVGVYRTGETARGALYLYPFLMIPVAYALRDGGYPTNRSYAVLAMLVFAQSVAMQLVGDYFW